MIKLLADISRLEAVQDIILLSSKGEMLFGMMSSSPDIARKQMIVWKGLISLLKMPNTAVFHFQSGLYYVFRLHVGYIIAAVRDEVALEEVKKACIDLQASLSDTAARKKTLLQMLDEVDDILKPHVVEELVPLADTEVGLHLLSLLRKYDNFQDSVKDRLLILICQSLGHCKVDGAIDVLLTFLKDYQDSGNANRDLEKAVQVSITQLGLDEQPGKDLETDKVNGVSTENEEDSLSRTLAMSLAKSSSSRANVFEENRIKRLVAEGKTKDAGLSLLKRIEIAAKKGKFEKAEKLRQKLIEIDPTLISEIIRSAEIIEEEKIAAIKPEHLKTWNVLAGLLNQDEFTSLYHAMTTKEYKKGEKIVRQGEFLSQLFFINSGHIELYAHIDGQEIPVKLIDPGEILGGGTFFEASVWTLNARSLGTEILTLGRVKLDSLSQRHPKLESKLLEYCALFPSPRNMFRRTNRSRRRFERKKITGSASLSLLDSEMQETGVGLRGNLFEISRGGLSLCINISSRRNALLLFGSKIKVALPSADGFREFQHRCCGRIVAVRGNHLASDEYSLHIEFDDVMAHNRLLNITG